jgi:hypothetical protein
MGSIGTGGTPIEPAAAGWARRLKVGPAQADTISP